MNKKEEIIHMEKSAIRLIAVLMFIGMLIGFIFIFNNLFWISFGKEASGIITKYETKSRTSSRRIGGFSKSVMHLFEVEYTDQKGILRKGTIMEGYCPKGLILRGSCRILYFPLIPRMIKFKSETEIWWPAGIFPLLFSIISLYIWLIVKKEVKKMKKTFGCGNTLIMRRMS